MDFFGAQAAARSRSRTLTALFGAAVAGIVVTVYLAVWLVAAGGAAGARLVDPPLFLAVAAPTLLLVAAGSAYRIRRLRAGGPAVAALMGGRRVLPDSTDPAERRLLNVVEEMAIASGVPVPATYVLDAEDGMNAFAAGYTIHDAAIAVTAGTLRGLTRDELQGVVAHEFSHVLNGDMRLNVRLIGLLHGILLLAVVGRALVRGSGRRSGRSRGGGKAALVGAVLVLVGYVGVFFGKLIRAGISREREYLADAAAVQFTRNPQGISGALKKIGASSSRLASAHAEEASHLFFAHALRPHWIGFLATHPPLDERIRRIDPQWDGWLVPQATEAREPGRAGLAVAAGGPVGAASQLRPAGAEPASVVMAAVGSPDAAHLEHASRVLERIPGELRQCTRDGLGARAVVLALLLASDESDAPAHRAAVREAAGDGLSARVAELERTVRALGPELRLPLLDLALPALRALDPETARGFLRAVLSAIRADGGVRMFEYTLAHVLARELADRPDPVKPGREIQSFRPIRHEVAIVLSGIARAGGPEAARTAFAAGAARLPPSVGGIHLLDAGDTSLPVVDRALERLARTSFGVRRRLLDACAHCAMHDGRVRPAEAELLRAIGAAIDCPIPPLLPAPAFGAPLPGDRTPVAPTSP